MNCSVNPSGGKHVNAENPLGTILDVLRGNIGGKASTVLPHSVRVRDRVSKPLVDPETSDLTPVAKETAKKEKARYDEYIAFKANWRTLLTLVALNKTETYELTYKDNPFVGSKGIKRSIGKVMEDFDKLEPKVFAARPLIQWSDAQNIYFKYIENESPDSHVTLGFTSPHWLVSPCPDPEFKGALKAMVDSKKKLPKLPEDPVSCILVARFIEEAISEAKNIKDAEGHLGDKNDANDEAKGRNFKLIEELDAFKKEIMGFYLKCNGLELNNKNHREMFLNQIKVAPKSGNESLPVVQ